MTARKSTHTHKIADQGRRISIHSFLPSSRANGPGCRAVVWVQGCAFGCPACFNPETHDINGGEVMDTDALAGRLIALDTGSVEGVSISGGEPFLQPEALKRLLARVRHDSSFSVLIFSGFRREEIEAMPVGPAVLSMTDILIDGRYDRKLHEGSGLVGSSNQRIHFLSSRYTASDLEDIPSIEVIINLDGTITTTGMYGTKGLF